MKLSQKHFYPLIFIIIFSFSACRNSKNNDKTDDKKETKKEIELPKAETLSNFDNTYVGTLTGQAVHLNLRRYGNQASGNYWLKNNDLEFQLTGQYNEDNTFSLNVSDVSGKNANNPQQVATFNGTIKNDVLEGIWKSSKGEKKLSLKKLESKARANMKVDNILTEKKSPKGDRLVDISYPKIVGITDLALMNKTNKFIKDYFFANTLLSSIDDPNLIFKEDVNYKITCFDQENVSISKQHHLSKNGDVHVVDDTHGININLKRGKIYQIQDLFKPNAIEQLNKLILENINKNCGGSLDEKQLNDCKLKLEETNSFTIEETKRDGLKVTFHLTERLPYKIRACGYVRLRYDDLKDLINPSGPLDTIQERLIKIKK